MLQLTRRPSSALREATGRPGRCCLHVRCATPKAGAGFGDSNKKITDLPDSGSYLPRTGKRRVDLSKEFGDAAPAPVSSSSSQVVTPDFKPVGNLSVFPPGKNTKVVDLAGYGAIVLYRHRDSVYASNVVSTAYSFPMVDAKVLDGPDGEAVAEVPLDGTQYDLRTGKVLKWCPAEGNPLRSMLSALKKSVAPVDLVVYQTIVNDLGNIFVKVTTRTKGANG